MPARPEIAILYQDDHLMVVDKPARMLVVPAPGRSGTTVVDALRAQLGIVLHPVHRLDEDTTGVLVLACTPQAGKALEEMFRRHEIERIYMAVVAQMPSPPAGRIESRLRENPDGVVESVTKGPGKRAVTHYRAVRRADPAGVVVECRLETGRRNQIRVHLAELGCPVVGDRKDGHRVRAGDKSAPRRPLLHAHRLRFDHPFSGKEVAVRAELPEDFPRP